MTIHFSLGTRLIENAHNTLHLLPVAKFSTHTTEHLTASLSMHLFSPVGALDDFALSDYGTPDAIRSRVVNYSSQLNSAWVRPYTVVNQPVDYPQSLDPINNLNSTYFWKQSRYVAAGMKWTGVPLTGVEYLDKVQCNQHPLLRGCNP